MCLPQKSLPCHDFSAGKIAPAKQSGIFPVIFHHRTLFPFLLLHPSPNPCHFVKGLGRGAWLGKNKERSVRESRLLEAVEKQLKIKRRVRENDEKDKGKNRRNDGA
jgi:hypothetical protein